MAPDFLLNDISCVIQNAMRGESNQTESPMSSKRDYEETLKPWVWVT